MYIDSIFYIDNGCSYTIPIGEALGEFTDELNDATAEEEDYIVEMIAVGPKSYWYCTAKGVEVTKMKGFTLNHQMLQQINAQSMKQLIEKEISILSRSTQITRDSTTKQIVNKPSKKRLIFDYNKRLIASNYDAIPYRYE